MSERIATTPSSAPSASASRAEPAVSEPGASTMGLRPERLLSRFNLAFGLMSVIPMLICIYLITVKFFTIQILEGLNGVYVLLAVIIALLGLLLGRQVIRDVIHRLVATNAKLQDLYNQQASFVGNVAHEFRSPLAVFKGALDNLADGLHGALTTDQLEPVMMCQKEVNRLKRLVSDLLDVSKIEAGKLPMTTQDLVLQDVVKTAGNFFHAAMQERGLALTVEMPQEPAHLIGDRDRLQQVFVNLLSNAMKFTVSGEISLRLLVEPQAYRIEVADTGPGIAPENLEKIFDKFEQLSAQQEGSGLGLPIARDIVKLHRGRMWVESQLGKGSRFIVQLPMSS